MFRRVHTLFLIAASSLIVFLFSSFLNPEKPLQRQSLKTIVIDAGHGSYDVGAQGEYSNEATLNLQMALKLGKKLEEALPNVKIVYTRTDENFPGNAKDKNEANRLRAKIANEAKGDLFISIHVNSLAPRYQTVADGTRKETYHVYQGKGKNKKKVTKTRIVTNYKKVRIPHTRTGTETYIWAVGKNESKKSFVKSDDDSGEQEDSTYQYFDGPEAYIRASLMTAKYFKYSQMAAQYVEDEFTLLGRPSYGVKQRNNEGIWVLQATAMPSILVETGFICTPADEAYLNSAKGQDEITNSIKNAVLKYKNSLEGTAGK